MSASPIRRRVATAAIAVVSLVVLGGCTTAQKTPGSYSGAEDNFLDGCTEIAEQDNASIEAGDKGAAEGTKIASPKDYCQCVFDAIEKTVPWDDFKKTQSRMQDEGGPLPDNIIEAYDGCKADAS